MEHIGSLPETDVILSPTIIPLFGILCPPAKKEVECHFYFEKISRRQFLVLKFHVADNTPTRNVSKLGHQHLTPNQQYAAHIVEHPINTKNSIVQTAATQKFIQNAQQTSRRYSHS